MFLASPLATMNPLSVPSQRLLRQRGQNAGACRLIAMMPRHAPVRAIAWGGANYGSDLT
jgi:hypothetical protein